MSTKKIVQELITHWRYKVDASQIKKTAQAIQGLKKNFQSVRRASVSFGKGEFKRIRRIRDGWQSLNKSVTNYRRNLDKPARGLGVGARGKGSGKAGLGQSAAFLAGRVSGNTAITSALLGGLPLVAGLGIGAVMKKAGEREKQQKAFSGLLGGGKEGKSKADDLLNRLNTFAKETPFQIDSLRELARQSLGGGMGLEEVIPQLRMLGDATSGSIVYLRRMLTNMIEIKNTQLANIKDVRQFGKVGIPIYEALSKTLGKTTPEIMRMVSARKIGFKEVTKALESLTQKGGRFFEAMALQMKTMLAQLNNLGDALIVMAEKIGKPLLEPITIGVKALKRGIEAITGPLAHFTRGVVGIVKSFAWIYKWGTKDNILGYVFGGAAAIYVLKLARSFSVLNRKLFGIIALFLIIEDLGVWMKNDGGKSMIGVFVQAFEKLNKLDLGDAMFGSWLALMESVKEFGNWLATTAGGKLYISVTDSFQKLTALRGFTMPLPGAGAWSGLPLGSGAASRTTKNLNINNSSTINMKPDGSLPKTLDQTNNSTDKRVKNQTNMFLN